MAVEVLQALGHPRAIALQGLEGSVTPSVRRRTRGIEACDKHLVPLNVEPEDFGLHESEEPEMPFFGPPDDGKGTGDNPELIKASAQVTRAILAGERGPARSAAVLGAAVMVKASGLAPTLAEGVDAVTKSLESGAAQRVLDSIRDLSS
jgi:anthranilate phosphoribosyltransferase